MKNPWLEDAEDWWWWFDLSDGMRLRYADLPPSARVDASIEATPYIPTIRDADSSWSVR